MIKLIVGKKGTGKTKALVERVNEAVAISKGNVVCIEKDLNLTYSLNHKARLVVADEYGIDGYDEFFGFISGLLAGNYDITHLFVDGVFKIVCRTFCLEKCCPSWFCTLANPMSTSPLPSPVTPPASPRPPCATL